MARNKFKSKLERSVDHRLDQLKRDILLENDVIYSGNVRQLRESVTLGKVKPEQVQSHLEWLAQASLRRNHVSPNEARRLMRA
jgi:hypothetical protein